ncbi:AAA family ATPase [Streptomyces sp. NPDC093252]|uniref:AAA family ATPase n=1 Tax=Streptomyces sp. NPDC093252 TaxID=3154980 RepID=UPI00341B9E32
MEGRALFGRDAELGALDAFVAGLREAGAAVVVRGTPGIGKSALLDRAARTARDAGYTVLTASGVEAETHLPHAGLHQLTHTMLDGVAKLPAAQAAALLGAFGMAEPAAGAPQFFMIALATLSLLGDAAEEAPVLLVVDDAQWLDTPTLDVLAFVARRLGAEPLGLLAGVREGHPTPLDALSLPEIRPAALPPAAAGALLDAVEPHLEPAARHRVLDAAAGNPLALIELPSALRRPGAAEALTSAAIPLTTRLRRAFASRLTDLPPATRAALLVAALTDEGAQPEILAAGGVLRAGTPGTAEREPETPGPATPGPATPGPATPRPATPDPAAPHPPTPDPATPDPTPPHPTTTDPTAPHPRAPDPAAPHPPTPDPTAPHPTTPDPTTPAPLAPAPRAPAAPPLPRSLPPAALDPAVASGLVTVVQGTVGFSHPLVRSAVLQSVPLAERLAAHRALAEVLDGQPDRQVWHRAAAGGRPDESVARALDATAGRASARGAPAVALAALERAVALTADPPRLGARLLAAAELTLELGDTERARALLHRAAALGPDAPERARLVLLREGLEADVATGVPRLELLLSTAEGAGDPELALRLLRAAARRCWWADPGRELRERVVAAAERLPVPALHPDLVYVLAAAAPLERGGTVIERLERLEGTPDQDVLAAATLGTAATMAGAYDHAAGFLRHAAAGLRAQGRLGLLAQVLVSLSFTRAHVVDREAGLPGVAEALRLAEDTGQRRWLSGALIARAQFAAVLGDEPGALTALAAAERHGLSAATPSNLAFIQIARGMAALAGGRHGEAFGCVWRVFDPTDPAHHPFLRTRAITVLAEAAVSEEHRATARTALAGLQDTAAATPARMIRADLAFARALLAEDDRAEERFREAFALDLSQEPFTRARLLLAQGAWLRRRRRVMESRVPLRIARESFAALGAEPWHDRACRELRSAGEGSDRRSPADWERLTPQELQIAQLAASGLSNREIGQQLYLSPRTVGAHLYRIYPKLRITSRGQLAERLGAGPKS